MNRTHSNQRKLAGCLFRKNGQEVQLLIMYPLIFGGTTSANSDNGLLVEITVEQDYGLLLDRQLLRSMEPE